MYKVPAPLAPVVYIPGLLYEALIRAHNGLYATGVLPRRRLPAPVISIGNITMGGAGKTPLVMHVAQLISNLGWSPAVLTRGYGRRHPGALHILQPGEPEPSPAMTLGDEPALIRRRVPSAWMGVSKHRYAAGSILSKREKNVVFLLDDGFQHRKLRRDLDIVIIDSSQPLASNHVFPRGTLREPLSHMARCDAIVISGSYYSPEVASIEAEIQHIGTKAPIFHCRQFIQSLTPFLSWQKKSLLPSEPPDCENPGSQFTMQPANGGPARLPSAYLVSALGNPLRFQRDIRRIGIGGPGMSFFADHHQISPKDWERCAGKARWKGAEVMITTEKDAIKLSEPPDFPLLVAEQSTEIAEAAEFEALLKKSIATWR
jgi:tetraacyldisaccharide-1-P 4'-kinase